MRRALLAAALVLALAVAAVLASRRTGVAPAWLGGGTRNLLVVTLDTLRADHVGSYGYAAARTPRFDSLAARGLRFARAATVVPLTLPAHSSLFTGTFPARHGVRDNGGYYLGEEPETLAEVLKARGFRTGGFISAFVLDSRWGINQGFERYFDDFDLSRFEKEAGMDAIQRPGKETVDEALRWLAAEREQPFFLWVHLYDPHTPYAAPREYAAQFPRTLKGAYDACSTRSRPTDVSGARWWPCSATTARCWASTASPPTASSSTTPPCTSHWWWRRRASRHAWSLTRSASST
jgi:arylsulfatase A-like enzyme